MVGQLAPGLHREPLGAGADPVGRCCRRGAARRRAGTRRRRLAASRWRTRRRASRAGSTPVVVHGRLLDLSVRTSVEAPRSERSPQSPARPGSARDARRAPDAGSRDDRGSATTPDRRGPRRRRRAVDARRGRRPPRAGPPAAGDRSPARAGLPAGRSPPIRVAGPRPVGSGTMAEYVFTLRNVRKAHGDKVVLDNVTLSFLHGAKIGVVGPNGTGKSTLLKIMAGLEKANNGDAILDPDATVGMLQQEPPLTEGKTVLENVEEAVAEIKGKMDRFDDALHGDGRPGRRLRQAATTRWVTCRPTSTTPTRGTSTAASTRRWTRCAARRRTRWSTTSPVASAAGSRCASCCSSSPTCCSSTSPPTTSTPSRCSGSRATSRATRAPSWRSPTTGTSSTTSPSGSSSSTAARPTPTRATTRRTSRPRRNASRSRARRTPSAPRCWSRSWSGSAPTPRPGRPRAGPVWRATRRWRPRPTGRARSTPPRSTSRPVRGSATSSSRPRG